MASPSTTATREMNERKLARAQKVLDAQEELYLESFFFRPHTLSILIVAIGALVYAAFQRDRTEEESRKMGLAGACCGFLLFCTLQLRETIFTRPHPALWRFVTGVAVLYSMLLSFLLFQDVNYGRNFFKPWFPELGVALPERNYAEDCRVFAHDHPSGNPFSNVLNAILDEFVVAHFLGWWVKTLIIRDYRLCWILSILFEFMEISFMHMLPNFAECWWDSLLLDIFGCNALGIYMGMKTCQYFEMKRFSWVPVTQLPTSKEKLARVVLQFTPESWDKFEWNVFMSAKRFLYMIVILFVFLCTEVTAFFLKFVLWIPPRNPLNTYRMIMWAFFAAPSAREFYQFVTDKNCKKLGTMTWLVILCMTQEVLIVAKYGEGLFPNPPPPFILYSWSFFALFLVVFMLWFFWLRGIVERTLNKPKHI
eukprot:TRINITY_DN3348_c0_g1_i1.p1 TRINITY_DN3348_c0_g1~~TRINITY_DN3348_c0_g1_i1.p1  ORF type:complete len:423 (-),score=100.03 TRINITY_DN3348_c0_g1_i1:37-1305(-)